MFSFFKKKSEEAIAPPKAEAPACVHDWQPADVIVTETYNNSVYGHDYRLIAKTVQGWICTKCNKAKAEREAIAIKKCESCGATKQITQESENHG